jgi:hypothetical protein
LTNLPTSLHKCFSNHLHLLHQNQIQQCLLNNCKLNPLLSLSKVMIKDSLPTHPISMENQLNTRISNEVS